MQRSAPKQGRHVVDIVDGGADAAVILSNVADGLQQPVICRSTAPGMQRQYAERRERVLRGDACSNTGGIGGAGAAAGGGRQQRMHAAKSALLLPAHAVATCRKCIRRCARAPGPRTAARR